MTCWRPLEKGNSWLLHRCRQQLKLYSFFTDQRGDEVQGCVSEDLVQCLEGWGLARLSADDALHNMHQCCYGSDSCDVPRCCCVSLFAILLVRTTFEEASACFGIDLCSTQQHVVENAVATAMWAALSLKHVFYHARSSRPVKELLHYINKTKVTLGAFYNMAHPKGFIPYSTAIFDSVTSLFVRQHAHLPLFVSRRSNQVFNPFTNSFGAAHAAIFSFFPPSLGPPLDGHIMDFLGVTAHWRHHCGQIDGHVLDHYPPGRALECLAHVQGHSVVEFPILDEEYFEWIDVLHAAFKAARRGGGFAMAEIGSLSAATWAIRAAVAFHRLAPRDAKCELFILDPETMKNTSVLQERLAENLPAGRCNVSTVASTVGRPESPKLSQMLTRASPGSSTWDLIDLDCQGGEHKLLREELVDLTNIVRILHISTHSREIHDDVLHWLSREGWAVPVQFNYMSVGRVGDFKEFVSMDGHITAISPMHLSDEWLHHAY